MHLCTNFVLVNADIKMETYQQNFPYHKRFYWVLDTEFFFFIIDPLLYNTVGQNDHMGDIVLFADYYL